MKRHYEASRGIALFAVACALMAVALALHATPVPAGARFEFRVPGGILLPVAAGVLLVAARVSPIAGAVRTAQVGGVAWSTAVATVLVAALAVAGSGVGASAGIAPAFLAAVVRNLGVSVVAGSIGVVVLGPRLSWLLPIGSALIAMVAGRESDGTVRAWAFVADPASSWLVAALWLGGGLIAFGPLLLAREIGLFTVKL